MINSPIRVGIVGWGNSARYFHIPLLQCLPSFQLGAIVTTQNLQAAHTLPELAIYDTFEALLADSSIELIVVATPHRFHFEHARAVLRAGKHVIVEKPLVLQSDQAQQLNQLAQSAGKLLAVFQNRRWDGDWQTIQQLIKNDALGQVYHVQSAFPLYRPTLRGVWREDPTLAGGMLYDLGPHLVDQIVALFGRPQSVYARTAARRVGAKADDYFVLHLAYASGLQVIVTADLLMPCAVPRFQIRGSLGCFEKFGLDPQEAGLRAGKLPHEIDWGVEDQTHWGILYTPTTDGAITRHPVPTLPGDYRQFYHAVFESIRHQAPFPITIEEIVLQLTILTAAKQSAQTNTVILIGEMD